MDRFSKKKRSKIMKSIKSKNTGPEKAVRSGLYKMGYGFRLHLSELPGTPDIVLQKYGVVIFVNGCFWHQHDCGRASLPKTNKKFWKEKFEANKERDRRNLVELKKMGWKVITVWECELDDVDSVLKRISRTLKKRSKEKIKVKKNGKQKTKNTKAGSSSSTRKRRKSRRKGARRRRSR